MISNKVAKTVVLMYHDIVTDEDKSSGFQNESAFQYKVEKSLFEKQVKSLNPKDVVFSFDDGGISFYEIAAPILEKYGHKGVFFIATEYIGTSGFLNVAQVKELEVRGHVIGSHSCSHPHNMAELPADVIQKEWFQSIKVLEDILGHRVLSASIPNGYSSKVVVNKAKQAGIKYLYTSTPTDSIKQKDGIQLIGRYVVHDKMTIDEVRNIVQYRLTRRKKYVKWFILEMAKKILGHQYDRVKALIIRK